MSKWDPILGLWVPRYLCGDGPKRSRAAPGDGTNLDGHLASSSAVVSERSQELAEALYRSLIADQFVNEPDHEFEVLMVSVSKGVNLVPRRLAGQVIRIRHPAQNNDPGEVPATQDMYVPSPIDSPTPEPAPARDPELTEGAPSQAGDKSGDGAPQPGTPQSSAAKADPETPEWLRAYKFSPKSLAAAKLIQ